MERNDEAIQTKGRVIHWARQYDWLVKLLTLGKEKAIRETTLELAKLSPGDKVLDVGCGTGTLAIMAKGIVGPTGEVYGIDPAPEMIDVARHKSARASVEVNLQVGLIEAIPFPECTFDVVLSSLMVHHLPDDVKAKGLREVQRVLRPGGRLLVIDMKLSSSTLIGKLHAHLGGHGRMKGDVPLLPEMLREAAFKSVEMGATRYRRLSYALAIREDS